MPSLTLPRPLLLAPALVLVVVLSACGGGSAGSGSGSQLSEVAVTATDDSCELDTTDLPAGDITFAVSNKGDKVTEVYVYGEDDGAFTKVVSEVENIGPGTGRDMVVDLAAGTYEIACKPGQQGDGIRTEITVTGEGGAAAAEDEGYDREIELSVDDTGLTGLDEPSATTGERIEFKLENTTDAKRTFEVLDPAGEMVAEFDVPAGEEGEAIVELVEAGDWTLKVEGGATEIEQTLTVS